MSDSIYQPPSSELEERQGDLEGFGSLDRALAGDVDFDIMEIVREGWQLTSGSKGVIIGAMALLYGVIFGGSLIASMVLGPGSWGAFVAQQLVNLVTYPLMAGSFLYALKRAANDRTAAFSDVLSCYELTLPLFGLYLLQFLLILIGFALLVLPGIYLGVGYALATLLLVERRLGVWESLEASRKAITHVWLRFFGLLLLLGFSITIGMIVTLGIGLIWLVPWAYLCLGVAYRRMFGVRSPTA